MARYHFSESFLNGGEDIRASEDSPLRFFVELIVAAREALVFFVLLVPLAVILQILYGGIHLSAWNYEFPTATEELLWKLACIFIAAACPVMTIIASFFIYTIYRTDTFRCHGCILALFMVFGFFLFVFLLLAVFAARMYIVIESFISLRSVPIGVYWTPSWIQMIPHI
ncbi:hypothetical protein QBC38DRAFT_490295 [Podospora fimiseda]|uniref:Uncharacterized protein n=1 Tax=Podospora fimiseda TaxID=252190 RepID=A0AAN7BDZ9_9PEZI|nr:hypothetical protein QBC38DRAFT_490295 [Podospora fimiseda]